MCHRDQKCLSDSCTLLPRTPLPAMQGVFCWSRRLDDLKGLSRPKRFYDSIKNQNAAAKGLVRAGAEHHRAQLAVWSVWGLLLGLCAPHCPCSPSAFCSPSPALGSGSTHARCRSCGAHCSAPSRASAPRSWRLLSCAKGKKAAKQAQPGFTQYCCSSARKQTVKVPVFKAWR